MGDNAVEEMVDARVQRYWGIWHDVPDGNFMRHGDGGFLRHSNGMLIYYPHPGIAQAHADDLMREGRLQQFTNLSVREFVYDRLES